VEQVRAAIVYQIIQGTADESALFRKKTAEAGIYVIFRDA